MSHFISLISMGKTSIAYQLIDFPEKVNDINDLSHQPVADPGFPIGGVDLVGGRGLLRWLHFENCVC